MDKNTLFGKLHFDVVFSMRCFTTVGNDIFLDGLSLDSRTVFGVLLLKMLRFLPRMNLSRCLLKLSFLQVGWTTVILIVQS